MNNFSAIVVIGYNRPDALQRLLLSLQKSHYPNSAIPLVISLDKSDNADIQNVAEGFIWQYGPKRIIAHSTNLGLKAHVFKCGALAMEYGSIILLEDDLLVSPFFYDFAVKANAFYLNESKIAGIALYSYQCTENQFSPFIPVEDDSDTYLMQLPCSWGQLFTAEQWQGFEGWHKVNQHIPYTEKLPAFIAANWTATSWKKHFADYMINTGKFFVYPRIALSTNFSESGTNATHRGAFQVPLLTSNRKFIFKRPDNVEIFYDANFEINSNYLKVKVPELESFDFEVDLFGTKEISKIKTKYLLSAKKCTAPIITFGNDLAGCAQNILMSSEGNFYNLGKITDFLEEVPDRIEYHQAFNAVKKIILSTSINNEALEIARKLLNQWLVDEHKKIDSLFEDYVNKFKFHQEYPEVQIGIIADGEKFLLSKTLESIYTQQYPVSQIKIKIFHTTPIKAALPKANCETQYISYTSSTDLLHKLLVLNQANNALYYCIANAGDIFCTTALETVNRIFKRYADVVWLSGIVPSFSTDKTSALNPLGSQRWNAKIFDQSLKKPTYRKIFPSATFWTKYVWDTSKNDITLLQNQSIQTAFWKSFFKQHHLYTVALPLSFGTQQYKGLMEQKWIDRLFEQFFLSNTAYLRSYYKSKNGLPQVIRYHEQKQLFYLSDY